MARPLAVPLSLLLLSVAAGSCLSVTEGANTTNLDFDFTQAGVASDWQLGVADVPADQLGQVAADGGERDVPEALTAGTPSLYQSGTNVGGSLFLFQKKYWSGFTPHAIRKVSIQLAYVTNIHSGCTTGVGPSVVIKAGLTTTEPTATPDAQGVLRMNIDKGTGLASGDFVQLGDIRNGLTGCPATGNYAVNTTVRLTQPLEIETNFEGGFWIFLATQSGATGLRHEIYFTQVRVTLFF